MRADMAAALAHLLALWLLLWWPFAGRVRYLRVVSRGGRRRWSRSNRHKWLATAVLVPIVVLGDIDLRDVGVRWPDTWWSTGVLLVGVAIGGGLILLRMQWVSQRARLRRVIGPFVELVPRRGERAQFVWLAVTAGVTEELLFRAFGLSYVHWLWPDLSSDAAVLVTATAFGLAHLYQGWKNVLLTGLLGVAFAGLVIETRSVLPAIVVHILVDLRLLLLTPLVDPDPDAAPVRP